MKNDDIKTALQIWATVILASLVALLALHLLLNL